MSLTISDLHEGMTVILKNLHFNNPRRPSDGMFKDKFVSLILLKKDGFLLFKNTSDGTTSKFWYHHPTDTEIIFGQYHFKIHQIKEGT